MYSAFLIMNVNTDLKTINKEAERLTGNKNLSSIAI